MMAEYSIQPRQFQVHYVCCVAFIWLIIGGGDNR